MNEKLPISFAMDELKQAILASINESNEKLKLPPSLMEYVLLAVLSDIRQNKVVETAIVLSKGEKQDG